VLIPRDWEAEKKPCTNRDFHVCDVHPTSELNQLVGNWVNTLENFLHNLSGFPPSSPSSWVRKLTAKVIGVKERGILSFLPLD